MRSDCSPGSGEGADEAVAVDTAINADNIRIDFIAILLPLQEVLLFSYTTYLENREITGFDSAGERIV